MEFNIRETLGRNYKTNAVDHIHCTLDYLASIDVVERSIVSYTIDDGILTLSICEKPVPDNLNKPHIRKE